MKRFCLLVAGLTLTMSFIFLGGCSSEITTKNLGESTSKKADSSSTLQAQKAEASQDVSASGVARSDESKKPKASSKKSASKKSATTSKKTTAKSTQSSSKTGSSSSSSTKSSSSSTNSSTSSDTKITVTLSVDCKTAVDGGYKEALALTKTGTLAQKTLSLKKGTSVYDALKASGISVGSESTAMGVYIYALSSLAEKACGSKSGWLYSVNGTFISKSCDEYILKNGDTIRWRYTCDGGKDV